MGDGGDFAAHRRDGDDVIKVLNDRHPAGDRLVASAQNAGIPGMNAYLCTLRSAGIMLPPRLSVESDRPLTVRHLWVTGRVLLNYASTDPYRFIRTVVQIASWVRALDAADARIDTNLANFCLAGNDVVLVDVLPPLLPSLRPEPTSLFEVLFTALCFDTPIILDALIGYAARALLHAGVRVTAFQHDDLECQLPRAVAGCDMESFPGSWFRSRVVLALRALAGDAEPATVQDYFTLTSVRAFRDLPEVARDRRIRQVDQLRRSLL